MRGVELGRTERRALAERVGSEPLERVLARMTALGSVDAEFRAGKWSVSWWPETADPLPVFVGESKLLVVAARRAIRRWAALGR